jgi:mannose-6-phosphate isomerase
MSPALYPLTFQPIFKRYFWGGRRLGTLLGKPIEPEGDCAESWEIADHPHGQSVVASGPLAGTTLHALVESRATELLGRHAPLPRFPLIFKFLDCQRDLSVQVHPDDAAAARLDPPDLGKTEAWVILHADPGSRVWAGLKQGIDRAALAEAVRHGRTVECLHWFEARPGDCVFIPAGTVHALGAGLVVAEIQQASDTTFRLYDWDRVGPDGKPRPLHVAEALAVIDERRGPVHPVVPQPTDRPGVERLVACEKFVLNRWRPKGKGLAGGDDRFTLLSVLEGSVHLEGLNEPLQRGQTVLLPACLGPRELTSRHEATLLEVYLP